MNRNFGKKIIAPAVGVTVAMAGCLPLVVAPAFAQSAGQQEIHTQTAAPAIKKTERSEAGNPKVQKFIRNKQHKIDKDTVQVLGEAQKALALLNKGKNKEAVHALTLATGKLKVLEARYPDARLLPVDVSANVVDLINSVHDIKVTVQAARAALDEGQIQLARSLLSPLASEVVVNTTYLPLSTFPDVMSHAAALVDQGKVDLAKHELSAALNTLVIKSTIFPIPLLVAQDALAEAKTLVEKSQHEAKDQKKILDLLNLASYEVKRAQALGYGDKSDLNAYQKEIKVLQEKARGGHYGHNWFDRIEHTLKNLFDSSNKAHDAKAGS